MYWSKFNIFLKYLDIFKSQNLSVLSPVLTLQNELKLRDEYLMRTRANEFSSDMFPICSKNQVKKLIKPPSVSTLANLKNSTAKEESFNMQGVLNELDNVWSEEKSKK